MAKYPKKLTRAQFSQRNPGGSYAAYSAAYERQRKRFQAKQAGKQTSSPSGLEAALAALGSLAGPAMPDFGDDLYNQASSMVDSQIGGEAALIRSAAAAAAAQARQQQTMIGGLAQAGAGIAEKASPRIQDTYQGAANAQASFAKGFSDGLRLKAEAEAAQNAQDLGKWGAPAEQIEQVQGKSQGAPDVVYGAGGYIPASTLGREGAAYSSYAATLPSMMMRMGQLDAAGVARQAGEAQAGFGSQLSALAGQRTGMLQETVSALQSQAYEKWKAQRDAFEADREWQMKILATKAAMAATQAKEIATAQEATQPDSALSNSLGYLVDENGNPILDGAGNPIPTRGTRKDAQSVQDKKKTAAQKKAEARAKAQIAAAKNRDEAVLDLKANVKKYAAALLKPPSGTTDAFDPSAGIGGEGDKATPPPSYAKVLRMIRSAYESEITALIRKYRVKPNIMNAILREALAQAGYTPPPKFTANPSPGP